MRYSLVRGRKTCQICKKSFSNGGALSGHMVSHTLKRSAPNAESSASGSTFPSLETSNNVGANCKPHETVLIRSNHASKVGEPDQKSEDGGQQINGKRKTIVDEADSTGSRTPLTAVEEAGLILVAMSMGQRPENSQNWNAIDRFLATPNGNDETDLDSDDDNEEVKYKSVAELLTQNIETLKEDSDEDEDEDNDANDETNLAEREEECDKIFICDICGKILGSYQALGGHLSSNKCKRLKICDKNDKKKKNDQGRRYICEVCGRAFDSGQALGGHMKIHFC